MIVGSQPVAAICAIDALGTASMTNSTVNVRTSCPVCDEKIDMTVDKDGLTVSDVEPPGVVLWSTASIENGCAATSQCKSMLAFCSDDHLEAWRLKNRPADGFRLSPSHAVQIGAAIFNGFMD